MDVDQPLGLAIRQLRHDRQISVKAFADMLGVSRPTLWAWESGRTNPRRKNIQAIASALGIAKNAFSQDAIHPLEEPTDRLSCAINECKERIAEVAGIDSANVAIAITF